MEKPVRSSLQNLSISYECALAIGNSLNLPEMLHEVIHTMVHKTNAHRGIIWVKNGEEKLQPVASAGINIEDVLAQGEIMDIRDAFNQILKRQQFVLRYKDEKDFLQFCPVLTGNEESVLIVPVTNVAILYLVYASREIADEPLANLLASLSNKLSVAIEACTTHETVIEEIQVREKAEKELTKKTEQLVSSQKELQGLYGESEQARKSLLSILEDVRQKEEALKESESKLNSILSSIDDLVFVFDQEDRFILTQKPTSEQLYTTPDEFIGKKTSEVMPSHLNQIFLDAFDKIRKGQVAEYDYWLKMKGKTLWYSARHSPRFIDGELVGSVAVVRDITERKQLETELLVKNEVFEASISANSTSDNEGILTYVNSAFFKIFGYENKEEAVGKPISDFYKFEDEAMNIITALNETGVWEGEYTGLRKDKTTFAAYALATIIKDRSGDTIGYQSAVMDISDRKRMEEILRESEEKYSSVVENSMDGIIVLQKGIIKFLNQAILDLTGYNLEELIDKEFEHLLSPEYRKFVMDRYQARLAGKDVPSMYELEIIRRDGISVPVEVNNTTITYGGEEVTLSFIRNITERKQAEVELQKLNDELEERVIERTTELEEINKDLETMVKAFTGREIRMIELKDIIKDLEKQLAARENKGE